MPRFNPITSMVPLVVLLLAVPSSTVAATTDRLQQAQACTEEPRRLARLSCFDAVFETPVSVQQMPELEAPRPVRWTEAFAQEQGRKPSDTAIYRDTGHAAGHLVTVAALGALPPRPVMAVQCHNNITELSLMLAQPVADERIELAYRTAGGSHHQLWRVRDEGYVVSGGRGLPAISTLKELSRESQFELSASNAELDGLVFDLSGLAQALAPLRQACGW